MLKQLLPNNHVMFTAVKYIFRNSCPRQSLNSSSRRDALSVAVSETAIAHETQVRERQTYIIRRTRDLSTISTRLVEPPRKMVFDGRFSKNWCDMSRAPISEFFYANYSSQVGER